jgi:hypothetical protein
MLPSSEATSGFVIQMLDRAYDAAVDGAMGTRSAIELAERFEGHEGTPRQRAGALIRWQVASSSACGAIVGLGGPLTAVAAPLGVAAVGYLQLRMIAAVACMGGHDVRSDAVRSFAYTCLCGKSGRDVLKEASLNMVGHVSKRIIAKIELEALEKLNEAVARRLVGVVGKKGLAALGEAAPLVGACVAGFLEGRSTRSVGHAARDMFLPA